MVSQNGEWFFFRTRTAKGEVRVKGTGIVKEREGYLGRKEALRDKGMGRWVWFSGKGDRRRRGGSRKNLLRQSGERRKGRRGRGEGDDRRIDGGKGEGICGC